MVQLSLADMGINVVDIQRNPPVARLYERAVALEKSAIMSTGALATRSGKKTGRSPKDKRIVEHPDSAANVWWGEHNIPFDEHGFAVNRQRAIDFLNTRDHLYVVDGFAGWDLRYRIRVRTICALAYHALFMRNMLIRPSPTELAEFHKPDFTIVNAGLFPANPFTTGMTSSTSVDVSIERGEVIILGTQYAGEMKKAVFTVMNYLMPKNDVLSMHCSANEGEAGDVTLFFGLSGTGKTTLSADPRRRLIGDDEHCWSDTGTFNIEGGCYAKTIGLTREREPEIYDAIRFGAVLENVIYDEETRIVNYADNSITENTRAAYVIEDIANAKVPCVGGHPKNIIFLTCDAFGVLPPISKLTPEQAMYHFMSGYTAKVAGTEVGVTEPQTTFSACFGAPFMVWRPAKYAQMLAERIAKHNANVWLVNTGWTGGALGVGSRFKLAHTRAVIDAIHSGALNKVAFKTDSLFGFAIPTEAPGVPGDLLDPREAWKDKAALESTRLRLAQLFAKNFADKHASQSPPAILAAGPRL